MPFPNMDNIHSMRRGSLQNKLILDELRYDRVMLAEQHKQFLSQMTIEQKYVYDQILQAVNSDCGKVFFLYGYGGTGKTFVWNTISAALRSKGQIVLTVASSGIASLLLPGGRTAHSRFAIPLTPDEYSTYGKLAHSEDGYIMVSIPPELLITNFDDPIHAIVEAIYSDYLNDPTEFRNSHGRAILAPTINVVEQVNDYMLALNENEKKVYLSSDSPSFKEGAADSLASMHTPEFLATIKSPGLPNHELIFRQGCPVMLIRNIDHSAGLCNGTRLVITRLGNKVIEAEVLSGSNIGEKVFIPRMTLTPSDTKLPFKFQRRQFPLMLSYAMTINKSQGQSLDYVGLLLKQPVFTHGQLYVAVSRVTNKYGLKIVISYDNSNNYTETNNVVYHEIFRNI
ncbi:hypothetical protein AAHE18_10G141300 [Arachis hypogaea]